MSRNPAYWAALFAASLFFGVAAADDHTKQAFDHASAAANSNGDSKAVIEHATEAIKHVKAARAKATNPGVLKELYDSEVDLNSALEKAGRYNSAAAAQDARDAKAHLNAAMRK